MDEKLATKLQKQAEQATKVLIAEIESDVQPPIAHKAFESHEMLKKKAVQAFLEDMNNIQHGMEQGLIALKEACAEHPETFDQLASALIKNASTEESEESQAQDVNLLINTIYEIALSLSKENKIEKAALVLELCIALNPFIFDIWFLYGKLLQVMHHDRAALYAFQMGAFLKADNPYCYAHIAKSWIALGAPHEANASIATALNLFHKKDDEALFSYCEALHTYAEHMHKAA